LDSLLAHPTLLLTLTQRTGGYLDSMAESTLSFLGWHSVCGLVHYTDGVEGSLRRRSSGIIRGPRKWLRNAALAGARPTSRWKSCSKFIATLRPRP